MKQRYDSIDFMRALALTIMVPAHFLLFYSPYTPSSEWLFVTFGDVLGGLAAPVFLFLVGTSQALSMQARPDGGTLFNERGIRMVRRGLGIFLVAIFLSFSIEGSILEWDVLPLIAASLFVLCVLRNAPTWALIAISVAVFVFSPTLREAVNYLDYWGPAISPDEFMEGTPALFMDPLNEYQFSTDFTLKRILTGFFVTGYFPVFPWVAFPILGMVAGRVIYGEQVIHRFVAMAVASVLVMVGIGAASLAFADGTPNFVSGFITTLYFFPLTPPWMLIQVGSCFLFMGLCRKMFDAKPMNTTAMSYFRFLSRYSLTVYWFHYLIAYWPPRLMDILAPQRGLYVGNFVGAGTAVMLSFVALIGMYFVFMAWDKAMQGKYSASWVVNELAVSGFR